MAKTKRSKTAKGFNQQKKTNRRSRIDVSATGKALLAQIAQKLGLSRSEVVEEMAQGKVAVTSQTPEVTVTVTPNGDSSDYPTPDIEVASEPDPSQMEATSDHQQQLADKDAEISKLQQQLAQQQDLEQSYQTTSLQSEKQSLYIQELEQIRSQQQKELEQLNHQLNQLQTELTRQRRDYQQQLAAKQQFIEQLTHQIQTLQRFASIGEKQLNRWRPNSVK